MIEGKIKLSKNTKEKLKQLGVVAVYFFGSRVSKTHLPFSDIDLGIVVDNPKKRLDSKLGYFSKVYKAVTDDIPDGFDGVKLDISFLQKASPALGMKAVQEGELIMDSFPGIRADFEENILKRYNDYLPLKREYEEANIKAFSKI